MYLYQPCLMTLALYEWACNASDTKKHRMNAFLYIFLLTVSELELTFTHVELYPASLLFPFLFVFGRDNPVAWPEVLTAGLLGGMICWKVADIWPLYGGLLFLCAMMLLISAQLICRNREDRLLSCAMGGLVFELFFCIREHMLFSFCVIRLGSRNGLSVTALTLCLYTLLEELSRLLLPKKSYDVSARI